MLLLEGIFEPADVELADRHRLTVAVHYDEQLDLLIAAKPQQPIDIQLKMNSGMNRLGYRPPLSVPRGSARPARRRSARSR